MNIILGVLMLWVAYSHTRVAIDPNRANRATVRWNAGTLAVLTAFLGLLFLGLIGPGA